MNMEDGRVYINGSLTPMKSKYKDDSIFLNKYKYQMSSLNKFPHTYSVNYAGIESELIHDSKLNIIAKVNMFDNKESSNNITDLFSFLYYDARNNITTYSHYSTIKNLHFSPNYLGILDLKENYTPLALHKISNKLYLDIYEKNYNLLNILSN